MTPLERSLNERLREKGILIKPHSYIPKGYKLTDDGRDKFVHDVISVVQIEEAKQEWRSKMNIT